MEGGGRGTHCTKSEWSPQFPTEAPKLVANKQDLKAQVVREEEKLYATKTLLLCPLFAPQMMRHRQSILQGERKMEDIGEQIDQLRLLLLLFKTVTGPLSPGLQFNPCPSTEFYYEKHSCTGAVASINNCNKKLVCRCTWNFHIDMSSLCNPDLNCWAYEVFFWFCLLIFCLLVLSYSE